MGLGDSYQFIIFENCITLSRLYRRIVGPRERIFPLSFTFGEVACAANSAGRQLGNTLSSENKLTESSRIVVL